MRTQQPMNAKTQQAQGVDVVGCSSSTLSADASDFTAAGRLLGGPVDHAKINIAVVIHFVERLCHTIVGAF